MLKLYDATGRPVRKTLPMTSAHVRALIDGQYFLAHGRELLAALSLEPYCRHCAAAGLDAHIRFAPGADRVQFSCGHTAGHIRTDRETEVPLILDACAWGIRCSACQDEASGDNGRTDPTFKVTCSCTTREIANPAHSQRVH